MVRLAKYWGICEPADVDDLQEYFTVPLKLPLPYNRLVDKSEWIIQIKGQFFWHNGSFLLVTYDSNLSSFKNVRDFVVCLGKIIA
jgi:hypothetical protein